MANAPKPKITIYDAEIFYRNFAGREQQFNPAGLRNFAVFLDDPKMVEDMSKDGWNIKIMEPREEGDVERAWMQVTVGYRLKAPTVVMINQDEVRTHLNESMVEVLDFADISKVDLTVNGSFWEQGGKSGIKAYLNSMYVHVIQDELDRKYALPEDVA